MLKAPWPDFAGNPIHHGDTLAHPADTCRFIAVCLPDNPEPTEAWRAVYSDGTVSRLCLQIGDKGRATVMDARKPLSEDQIEDFCMTLGFTNWSEWDGGFYQAMWTQLVRAVEEYHGITPSAAAPRS